jgi:uncharacterized protein YndB with AHSA1/START domain
MRLNIEMEELFPVSIERVWHALTDPLMLERWLMRTDGYQAKVGVRFTLGETPRAECRGQAECGCSSSPRPTAWSGRGAVPMIPRLRAW